MLSSCMLATVKLGSNELHVWLINPWMLWQITKASSGVPHRKLKFHFSLLLLPLLLFFYIVVLIIGLLGGTPNKQEKRWTMHWFLTCCFALLFSNVVKTAIYICKCWTLVQCSLYLAPLQLLNIDSWLVLSYPFRQFCKCSASILGHFVGFSVMWLDCITVVQTYY